METAKAIELHDQLLENPPTGARHDSDICPICVDKATETANPPSRIPPGSAGPDVSEDKSHTSTEGGTPMSDNANSISQETHKALVKHAVEEATAATDKALQTTTTERDDYKAKFEAAQAETETLKADNARLNGELDSAQVQLKSATDKASDLETELAKERDDRARADVASKRAEQVKNLGLFEDQFIAERAENWASLDEAAWSERVTEWSTLKPAGTPAGTTDSASALSGTTEELTKAPEGDQASATKTPARRSVLGLS